MIVSRFILSTIGLAMVAGLFLVHGLAEPIIAQQPLAKSEPRSVAATLPAGAIQRIGNLQFNHPGGAVQLLLSPDGTKMVTVNRDQVIVWDVETGESIWHGDQTALPQSDFSYALRPAAFSPDGTTIYTVGNNRFFAWDIETGEVETKMFFDEFEDKRFFRLDEIRSIDVSPDGTRIALGDRKGVTVCEPTGNCLYQIVNRPTASIKAMLARDPLAHAGEFSQARFSPDGKILAVNNSDNTNVIGIYNAELGRRFREIPLMDRLVRMDFSPDSKHIVATERDNAVRKYEIATSQEVWQHRAGDSDLKRYLSEIKFNSDGQYVAFGAAFNDGRPIRILNAENGAEIKSLKHAPGSRPHSLVFSNDDTTITYVGVDGGIRSWHMGKEYVNEVEGNQWVTGRCAMNPVTGALAYIGSNGKIFVRWNGDSPEEVVFGENDYEYRLVAFSKNKIAGYGINEDGYGSLTVWSNEGENPTFTQEWRSADYRVGTMSFSPDGSKLIATMPYRSKIVVMEVNSNARELEFDHPGISHCVLSSDAKQCASVGWDASLRIWNIANRNCTNELALPSRLGGHGRGIVAVAWSPCGRIIATGSFEGKVTLLNTADLSVRQTFSTSGKLGIGSMKFSEDGTLLVTGTDRGQIEVWDVPSGKLVWNLGKHKYSCLDLEFGDFDRVLFSGGMDGMCFLWDLKPEILPEGDQDHLATELVGDDGVAAYRAKWSLLNSSTDLGAVSEVLFGSERPLPPKHVQDLVEQLKADTFTEREAAHEELLNLGVQIVDELESFTRLPLTAEQRWRLDRVLGRIEIKNSRLQLLRAVSLIASLNTTESEELLASIATEHANGYIRKKAREFMNRGKE